MSRHAVSSMRLPPIIGWGAGGHAKSVIEAVSSLNAWRIIGLIDSDASRWGMVWANQPILGGEDKLASLLGDGVRNAFVGVGGAGNNAPRTQVFQRLLDCGYELPTICHRISDVSPSATIGRG